MKIPSHYYRWRQADYGEDIPNDRRSAEQGWWLSEIETDLRPDEYDVDAIPDKRFNGDRIRGEGMPNLLTHAMIGDYTAIKGLCILVKRNPAKFGEYKATAEALVEAYESKRVKK